MDLNPRHFFNLLSQYLEDDTSGPKQCNQLFVNLNDALTREQVNLPDLDLYLQCFFNKSQGLLDFVTKIVNKKQFKSSIKNIFEIIYTLINNFSSKLEKYIPIIYEICFKIIKSSLVSSDEKVKALEVVILSFERINKCFDFPECYTDIYNSLIKTASIKKGDTVQGKILKALGAFAKHFQYLVPNRESLKIIFLNALESQMVQKEFSNGIVSGVFTGMDWFCESFPFDANNNEDTVIIKKIYKYIDRLTVPTSTIKTGNRAALKFLGNYMSLFINLMLEKIKHWHESLLKWLTYGADDLKVGVFVVEAFYRDLGIFFMKNMSHQYQDTTLYFLDWFKTKLTVASNLEKRLCLYGLSSFSGISQLLLTEEQRQDLLILLVQSFEQSFILTQDPSSDVLEDLPFYLQTLAKFIHFRKITNNELFCLQKATILLVKVYPQLPYSCHDAVVESLVSTFYFLESNDEKIFENFVENVIYQGVVWSCSHQHISEAEASDTNVLTVRSYFALWKKLLGILPLRRFDKLEIFLKDRRYILIKIIDKLMRTLLILINKLNVSITLSNTAEPMTDIQAAYNVSEVNDFAIFLNVVDFYEEIFEVVDPTILTKCAFKLIHHLVSKCDKFPLISGFYKLLSYSLKVCNKENYFGDANNSQDVKICTLTLTTFADGLLSKTQQYKGDLLIACLQLLLQYPIVVIRKMLPACVPSFKTIFYVGQNYIKLAQMALDTLEYWQKEIPSAEMQDFLIQIIPLLDFYLQSKSLGSFTDNSVPENRRKTARTLQKRKIVVNIQPELIRLQMRIIKFIGGQNNSLCEAFALREDNSLSVWTNQQHLKIVLPFEDISLDIYLDKLLPRIVNVALNSSDRKTRITACELLQAIVMVFLGTTKQMSESAKSDLNEMLRHVAVPLLKLGCDLDKVVEQLFRPLCFQLIHWYTHAKQSRSDHSGIIIEAILESITHPTDTALRDFSGKCINEFVKWTIKQTTEKNLAQDPINIKILVKKMRFYSTHPDPYKKQGAALIFNNIYRELREETSLLSIFWIEFLHIFVKSLSTYEFEDENTIVHIKSALEHLERGFIEKSELFNSNDKDRRVPTDFMGGTLKDVAVWLFEQTGSLSWSCRELCMKLFFNIAGQTPNFTTLPNFVSQFKRENWMQEIYEPFLVKHPTLEFLSEHESLGPNKWLQAFLCALDGYKFVISHKLIDSLSQTVITAINYFQSKVCTANIEDAFALIQPKEWLFTTFEKQTFDKQRSQAVTKIFQLLTVLPKIDHFCTPDLWNLVVNLLFNRQKLGFECFIPNSSFDKEITALVKEFLSKLPEDKSLELKQVLQDYISGNLNIDFNLKSYVPFIQRNVMKGLNMLLLVLDFPCQDFTSGMVTKLLNNFITNVEGGIIFADNLQDTTLNYCLSILDFALPNQNEFKTFVDFLYKPYQVQTVDYKQPILLGTYLLTLFEDSIMDKIVNNFEIFLELSLEQNNINQVSESIYHVLSHTIPKKQLKNLNKTVISKILQKWEIFESCFNSNIETGIEFVKCLVPVVKSSKLQCDNLKKWLFCLLEMKHKSWKYELDVKCEVFYLLVDIMDDLDDDDSIKGLIHIRNILLSSSVVPTEAKTVFLDKLLCVTPKIRTPGIFIFLLELYTDLDTEKSTSDMKSLLRDYTINNQQTQKDSISKLYTLYMTYCFDNAKKYKLVTNTASIFQYCNISVLEDFFVRNIVQILADLKQAATTVNVVKKISQFLLIEILFMRHQIRNLQISKIAETAIAENPSDKTLTIQILKVTLDAVKDTLDSDDGFLRLYKCHSYNTTASIVSNSLKTASFFTKLFVRQQDNVDILWSSLIDTNKVYAFQTDFETIPKRRSILVNIRNEIRANKKKYSVQSQSVRYVESMRVYNSSLSEDFSKFDFSNSVVRTEIEEVQTTSDQNEIELDGTDVNSHECMGTVCGLIQLMVDINVVELPTEEDTDYELPACFSAIRTLLLNPETHQNIKMFWIKVIDNTSHIFEHLAKWFLEPLLKFVTDKCAGTNINYFITDVVAILAAWSSPAPPSTPTEIQLASDLLTFLITNLNNERQDMFKYHLELIKLLIEAWKSLITVPYELLFSKLNVDPKSKQVEIGLHLFSIFLANKSFPWEDKTIEYCKTVFDVILKSDKKSTYKPAAESVGLLLRLNSKKPKLFNNVHVLLKKVTNPEKYAYILELIVLHYPDVADDFHVKVLLSRLHGVPKQLKLVYFKILLSRVNILSKIDEFKSENWSSYIENDDLEVQVVALQIVYECLEILRHSSMFQSIVESVCGHVLNSYVLCRSRMFDILISISQGSNYPQEVLDLCRPVLVQGLTDTDTEIREKIYDFWRNNHQLPNPISERFVFVLSKLYETVTESCFLGYSSHLLLDIIKKTEDYNKMLFEYPLEDCDFENYNLQTDWRLRHSSVVPLFAETVRSATVDFTLDPNLNQLRQTQASLEFAPTQSVRAKQFSQFIMSESSLFVKREEEFVNPNLVSLSHKYRVPKRRFLRDKSKIQSSFSSLAVKRIVEKSEQRQELMKERENKVTIYRSYRKGDLPDVQITLQAVLEPLQALSLHDAEISKILYSQLFKSILNKMKNDQTFMEQISSAIKFIFDNSTQCNRNLFQTLFDALLQCKRSIKFPAELIVTVSQSSGLRALGVLLLEEYLISFDTAASDPKKYRGDITSDINLWIKLAELYKEMDEWDVVKSIFLEKTESPDDVKDALFAESRKQWEEARQHYKNLLEIDESFVRKDFYYESYFKCFAHLGDWGKLVTAIDSIVASPGNDCWEDLWDEGFNQQKLLPWYIGGQLKNTLFTATHSDQFFLNLNSSLNSDRLEYLENHFCEEIAMLWICKGETDEAEKYLKMYLNKFLDNWQQLDLFYASLRYNNLLKLRNIIDIHKFLQVFNNFNVENTAEIQQLMNYWNESAFESLPSILYSEEKVLYRREFLNLLTKKANSNDADELAEILPQLNEVKVSLDEGLMDIGIEQKNFSMTKKYLNDYAKQKVFKFKLVVSKLSFIKAAGLKNPADKIDFLLKGCDMLEPIFKASGQSSLKLQAYDHFFKQLKEISLILTDSELFKDKKTKLDEITQSRVCSSDDVAVVGANKLKTFLHTYENELDTTMESAEITRNKEYETIADAYVKLAYFTKNQNKNFSEFMLFVLRAMKFNSSEGRQLFPCIIMEKEFNVEETQQFIDETSTIPVWMFLGWIPQILVNVDSPKVSAVAPLLLKIAQKYPQAIMYAYRLSKENYKTENDAAKELIEKLDLLLVDPQIDKFLTALSFVGIPAAILLYHVRKIIKFCVKNDMEQVETIVDYLQNEIFIYKPDSQNIQSLQGNMFKKISKFDKDFKSFERLLKTKSSNLDCAKKMKKIDDELVAILQKPDEIKKNSKLIKEYSPWLANFSAHTINLDLEIPGQYDGNKMPLTQHHVKIAGFCPNVLVMPSLRKPIKVTVLGNDTKEYPFLVKFGEDVRQDQRIQQLFSLMNNIFDNDKSLSGKKFSILTYQVIPLTTSLGIIQWIDNTSSFQDFVKNSAKDAKWHKSYENLFQIYANFVFKPANQTGFDAYGRAAMKYSRDKVIPKFRSLSSAIDWDVFRSQFLKISTNNESFFALRNNFIKSYAVMCVGHWILGVGDRHLSNSLICLQNGKVLGIDFGHAFGTATQILPVPELVPFRLTPHLVSLMEPLGEKGLFREIMVHCLQSLRSNSGSLLSTMNVFIEEPSLDWMEHASRFGESTEDCMWYPSQKIDQAQRKLQGAKSTTIIVEDLKAGHQKNENYMNAYIKLVEGEAAHDVRARKDGDNLSVEDQVDILIDHAADYNLLGRMFSGWAAWV